MSKIEKYLKKMARYLLENMLYAPKQAAWEDDGSTTVGKQMLEIIKAIDTFMKRCSFAE